MPFKGVAAEAAFTGGGEAGDDLGDQGAQAVDVGGEDGEHLVVGDSFASSTPASWSVTRESGV